MNPEVLEETKSFDCDVETVKEIRAWISTRLTSRGVPAAAVDDIILAASEAVTNAIMHGYAPSHRGRVDVSIQRSSDSVSLTVRDYGDGFRGDRYSAPDLSAPQENGYGVYLMHALMDSVDVQNAEKGTQVRMIRSLRRTANP